MKLWFGCVVTVMAITAAALAGGSSSKDYISGFELGLVPGNYWNGSDLSGGFRDGMAYFENSYNATWGSWNGFAYSAVNDTNTAGFGNQYAAWTPGTGYRSTGYAIVYDSAWDEHDVVYFPFPTRVKSLWLNNTTYAALSMLNGDAIAKKFGGATGNDPDWFKLTITGEDSMGMFTGAVEFYLADYRFTNNADDYIISEWTKVDLQPLGPNVKTMHFFLSSSDNGNWGMNTPSYFAMDSLEFTPRPGPLMVDFEDLDPGTNGYWNGADLSGEFFSNWVNFQNSYNATYGSWIGFAYSDVNDTNTAGYGNQYAAWTPGTDFSSTGNYAVVYDSSWDEQDIVSFPFATAPKSVYINNSTYAALSMLNGDAIAKKFGGATGNDPDWFKLTITGRDANDYATGSVEFYLADYRFTNSADDYIISNWTKLDLTPLGKDVKTLHFDLASSDNGQFGMNTPSYFVIDNIEYAYTMNYGMEHPNDIDGDGKSDFAVFRPATQHWIAKCSSDGSKKMRKFGVQNDVPVTSDYDGDGKTDIVVFRQSTGWWYGIMSSDGSPLRRKWGIEDDVAVPADYDGDGKAELAIFRPSTQQWVIDYDLPGAILKRKFGVAGDIPVPADYDGDGKADLAVFRPSTGWWYVLNSSDGNVVRQKWGVPGDVAVPADYDGDGMADLAVFRPSTQHWIWRSSLDGSKTKVKFGIAGDVPVPANYEGGEKANISVFRPSTGWWYGRPLDGGSIERVKWGMPGDEPTSLQYHIYKMMHN